jgi:hypothetical protein
MDSFRSLHPASRIYSFHCQNSPAACLDRAYLPPLLESCPRVARYLPTTSNHHAYLLQLETAGLAILPSLTNSVSADSLCWKFKLQFANPGSASRRFHLHRFVSQALELSLEAEDYTAVEARAHLRTLDEAVAAGIAIRTHAPLLAEEESGVFTNKLKAVEVPPLASVQSGLKMDRFSLHLQMWKEKFPHILRPIFKAGM